MAGYSGTPLVKKLGFKPGYRASLVNAPRGFEKELKQLPDEVRLIRGRLPKHLDLVVIFAESQKTLSSECPRLARKLAQNGMLWIAWPKKSSGVVTDLSGNSARQIGRSVIGAFVEIGGGGRLHRAERQDARQDGGGLADCVFEGFRQRRARALRRHVDRRPCQSERIARAGEAGHDLIVEERPRERRE